MNRAVWVLTVPALVVLAACGATEDNRSGPAAGGEVAKAGQDQGGAPAPAEYRREERAIIYTGEITVRVDGVDAAAARAGTLAEGAGGFVAGDKRSADGGSAEAHLTLRVPAERFMATVDEVAELGREESRSLSNEDVTQQVVDLDAQIASQKASVERTRALLARAATVGEIVSIEGELAKRESALATLEARKRRLADLSTLSTVTVHLLGPSAPAPADDLGFLTGLRAGWSGFVGATTVLLALLGFVLPFAIVLGGPAAVLWWYLRRRRAIRARQAPVTPARAPAPGAGG